MEYFFHISISLVIILLIMVVRGLNKSIDTHEEVLKNIEKITASTKDQSTALEQIEYVISGQGSWKHLSQKSNPNSLRNYLDKAAVRHKDLKLIKVELEFLRKLFEFKSIDAKTRIFDKVYRGMALAYRRDVLIALGMHGEALDKHMSEWERSYQQYDGEPESADKDLER